MESTKLYRVYQDGQVDAENADACIGQVYEAPFQCDICQKCGVNTFEISYMDQDVSFCAGCLRVLADLVEQFKEPE